MGARTIGVHADQDGMCMDDLRHRLETMAASGHALV